MNGEVDASGRRLIVFGQERVVEVVGNDGQFPLLGVGLLRDRRLEIDYRSRTLSIE